MAYCTLTDMKKYIPEKILITLSNDTAGAVAVDQVNIDEAIDNADREIDSYVSMAGFAVPLSPVPPLITNLSAQMAIWRLHLRKYFASELWERNYDKCVKLLTAIALGKLKLEPETTEQASDVTGYATESRTQRFTQTDTWDKF